MHGFSVADFTIKFCRLRAVRAILFGQFQRENFLRNVARSGNRKNSRKSCTERRLEFYNQRSGESESYGYGDYEFYD